MTTTRDLGTLDGPVLLFGGPYGNREATAALLAEAARRGIPWRRVICTGDVAAYCAEPQACVELIRERGIACVMGNCEEQLAADAEDCGCGFEEGTACAALSDAWFAYCRTALDREAKAWMGRLPRRIAFTLGGRRFAAIHGGVSAINRFVFASTPAPEKAAELDAAGTDAVIGGHCGLPFASLVTSEGRTRLWHNAGAIGLPANDGTPRVWFSILTPRPDGIRVGFHALAYDHQGAAARMRAAGLPEGYAAALGSGLWPSCDVLPPAELAARGRALAPAALLWPAGMANPALGQGRRAS
jgi:predicted phosphodiesterase